MIYLKLFNRESWTELQLNQICFGFLEMHTIYYRIVRVLSILST